MYLDMILVTKLYNLIWYCLPNYLPWYYIAHQTIHHDMILITKLSTLIWYCLQKYIPSYELQSKLFTLIWYCLANYQLLCDTAYKTEIFCLETWLIRWPGYQHWKLFNCEARVQVYIEKHSFLVERKGEIVSVKW